MCIGKLLPMSVSTLLGGTAYIFSFFCRYYEQTLPVAVLRKESAGYYTVVRQPVYASDSPEGISRMKPLLAMLWLAVLCCTVILCSLNFYGCSEPTLEPDAYPTFYDAMEFDGDHLITDWFDVINECVEQSPGYAAPVAARVYGYAGITIYESMLYGMSESHLSLQGQINGLDNLPRPDTVNRRFHWLLVGNSAMAELLRGLFADAPAAVRRKIDSLEQRAILERRANLQEDDIIERSMNYGKDFGKAMFEYSKNDGGHEAYKNLFPAGYQPPSGAQVWVPTPPAHQTTPMLPQWSKNRPFVLKQDNVLEGRDPGNFPEFSTDKKSAFYTAALEVYTTVKSLRPEQRAVAEYWADERPNTPTSAGHIISIATQLLRSNAYSADFAAEVYARVGIALNDGCIACWDAKYKYNLMRPLSYIQKNIDPAWNKTTVTDPMTTPPTPEYISGHALQATAAFEIMKSMFGNRFVFVDRTHTDIGLSEREYTTIDQPLQEILRAQLYSGTQFRFSIDAGSAMGRNVASTVMNRLMFRRVATQ